MPFYGTRNGLSFLFGKTCEKYTENVISYQMIGDVKPHT